MHPARLTNAGVRFKVAEFDGNRILLWRIRREPLGAA